MKSALRATRWWSILLPVVLLVTAGRVDAQSIPLIDSVPADLKLPKLEDGKPQAGERVREQLPDWKGTDVYHVLYLPEDYDAGQRYPLIVELAGNGGFRNNLGDVSTGVPEGSKLGLGVSGGNGFLWVCAPYLTADGSSIATRWWGDAPTYDVKPTVDYCKALVPWICENYHGDRDRVILAGFSRGAIACNFVGLHDDEISSLWCGFIAYSHYDGVRRWPYPGSDSASAIARLRRLGNRPQLICHESTAERRSLRTTQEWIESAGVEGSFTYLETGFRNHNDAWILRPSTARKQIRQWCQQF